MSGMTLFETAIGRAGVAWTDHGVARILIPGDDDRALFTKLATRVPDAEIATPPPQVQAAIDAMVRLLAGDDVDLSFVALDLEGVSDFFREIYALTRTIPVGETMTYGEIANRLGQPGAARAVGMAMGKNPVPIVVPCHRVLAAHQRTGGFSAPGGAQTKLRMLEIERAKTGISLRLFD
jgi:methylated-DNA-[protein]-cysteine S-methyltransferase